MTKANRAPRIAAVSFHTCPLEPPGSGDSGGLNVFVLGLAQALARRGSKVDIFTRRSAPDSPHVVIVGPGVRVVHIEAGPRQLLTKAQLAKYREDFAYGVVEFAARCAFPYEVVHSHYWMSGTAAFSLAASHSAVHVHTSHTLEAAKERAGASGEPNLSQARKRAEKEVFAYADIVTASTRYEAAILKEEYGVPYSKIAMLSPGFDASLFKPEGDALSDEFLQAHPSVAEVYWGDFPLVVAAGRIQPLKGFVLAVEAVDRMRALFPTLEQTRLLICGGPSGDEGESEVQKIEAAIAASSWPHRTVLSGALGRRELAAILRRADMLLVTSRSESFGMIALEALACGTPVVATASGGVEEILRSDVAGTIVGSRDSDDVARALGELLMSGNRLRARGRMAARSVRHRTWDRVAEEFLSMFSVVESGASASGSL